MTLTFDNFQRDPPPGFVGLWPDVPIKFYKRHLPHWRQEGATYFVTFRLKDALPPDRLRELGLNEEQRQKCCSTCCSKCEPPPSVALGA